MKNKYAILLLLIPSLYYLLAALFQINRPGFYYDEAFQLLPAINFTEDNANYYYDCALFLKKGTDSSPLSSGGGILTLPIQISIPLRIILSP